MFFRIKSAFRGERKKGDEIKKWRNKNRVFLTTGFIFFFPELRFREAGVSFFSSFVVAFLWFFLNDWSDMVVDWGDCRGRRVSSTGNHLGPVLAVVVVVRRAAVVVAATRAVAAI